MTMTREAVTTALETYRTLDNIAGLMLSDLMAQGYFEAVGPGNAHEWGVHTIDLGPGPEGHVLVGWRLYDRRDDEEQHGTILIPVDLFCEGHGKAADWVRRQAANAVEDRRVEALLRQERQREADRQRKLEQLRRLKEELGEA